MRFLSYILVALMIQPAVSMAQQEPLPRKDILVNIANAYVPETVDYGTDLEVVVNGFFPNGCYAWKNATVRRQPSGNVHEVRSYASVAQGLCIMVLLPFSKKVNVGQLDRGLHKVRFVAGDETFSEKTVEVR
jgi:hypothetical protein